MESKIFIFQMRQLRPKALNAFQMQFWPYKSRTGTQGFSIPCLCFFSAASDDRVGI